MKPSRKQVLDAAARLADRNSREGPHGKYWSVALSGGYGAAERNRVLDDITTLLDAAIDAPESLDAA